MIFFSVVLHQLERSLFLPLLWKRLVLIVADSNYKDAEISFKESKEKKNSWFRNVDVLKDWPKIKSRFRRLTCTKYISTWWTFAAFVLLFSSYYFVSCILLSILLEFLRLDSLLETEIDFKRCARFFLSLDKGFLF